MTPEKYQLLSEHLKSLDPTLEDFCKKHGFSRQTTAVSRYAFRRINRVRELSAFIEYQMDCDENGKHFESFFPEAPYSMGFGVWMDFGKTRYGWSDFQFRGIRFCDLPARLNRDLEEALCVIDKWNKKRLMEEGRKATIS